MARAYPRQSAARDGKDDRAGYAAHDVVPRRCTKAPVAPCEVRSCERRSCTHALHLREIPAYRHFNACRDSSSTPVRIAIRTTRLTAFRLHGTSAKGDISGLVRSTRRGVACRESSGFALPHLGSQLAPSGRRMTPWTTRQLRSLVYLRARIRTRYSRHCR